MNLYSQNSQFIEKWFKMSIPEQMGNIGSEVDRIIQWQNKGKAQMAHKAFCRALDLIDLSKRDPKWIGPKLKEINRIRETLCDCILEAGLYNVPLSYFSKYFMQFATLAKRHGVRPD